MTYAILSQLRVAAAPHSVLGRFDFGIHTIGYVFATAPYDRRTKRCDL